MGRTAHGVVLALAIPILGACGDASSPRVDPDPPGPVAASVSVFAGDGQVVPAGEATPLAPAVIVRDEQGRPFPGATVQFEVAAGGGTLEGATQLSDGSGVARVTSWTLGDSGEQRLTATVGTLPAASIEATVAPGSEILSEAVPTGGGVVTISTSGHPYEGLALTVPPGSFPNAVDVRLRVNGDATVPTMPTGYRVDGPPLEIALDAPRSDGLMTLEVPVRPGPGEAAVAVLYDRERGVMEVLPTVARSDTGIEVVTEHLRSDLLLGPESASGSPQAAAQVGLGSSSAELLRIIHAVPQPPVPSVYDPAAEGWPVVDHGSAAAPGGLGEVITALQVFSRSSLFTPRSSINTLSTPGFYADAAVLGALQTARNRPGMSLSERLRMASILGRTPKAERDDNVYRTTTASMALTGRPAILAMFSELAGPSEDATWFTTAVASSEEGLSVSQPADPSPRVWPRTPAGLANMLVRATADGTFEPADAALPLSSFVYDFETTSETLGTIRQFEDLPPLSRLAVNSALRERLGVPKNPFETSPLAGLWSAGNSEDVVPVRGDALRLRVGDGSTEFSVHDLASGALLATSGVEGVDLAPLVGSENGETKSLMATTFVRLNGLLRQLGPEGLQLVRARFAVSPDTARISADSTTVSFEADVPSPPSDGFLIRWDWGDGTTTENLGLTSAMHTYAESGEYTVVATMLSADGQRTLAVDTLTVEDETSPHWRLTNIVDADELGSAASVPVTVLLADAVANPSSAMIGIDLIPFGPRALQMRVLAGGTWTTENCCDPLVPLLLGETRQRLGVQPTLTLGVGDFFTGFSESRWSQSTPDLSMGTISGQQTLGVFIYNVRDAGSQTGPQIVLRTEATRSGKTMTGTITLIFWPIGDVLPGETLQYVEEPDFYRFPFTAERIR